MTRPRRVDFFSYEEDFECAYLGSLGFSTRYIERVTKLSSGKITYRLKKAKVKRIDYRDGNSDFATIIQRSLRGTLTKTLSQALK